MSCRFAVAFALCLSPAVTVAQAAAPQLKQRVPAPGAETPEKGVRGLTEPDEPEHLDPAATDFNDARNGLSFHVPAGWNFERRDGQLSAFRKDVRSARRTAQVRGVATINYNPYPASTFAGAAFYYSTSTPSTAAACAAQATTAPVKPQDDVRIAGLPFQHGRDQHGTICTESRDEVFTAMRGPSCLRFDLVVNTFCRETSGAMEITARQLADIDARMAKILDSVHIDGR